MKKLPHTAAGPQNATDGSEVRVPERKGSNPVDKNKKTGEASFEAAPDKGFGIAAVI